MKSKVLSLIRLFNEDEFAKFKRFVEYSDSDYFTRYEGLLDELYLNSDFNKEDCINFGIKPSSFGMALKRIASSVDLFITVEQNIKDSNLHDIESLIIKLKWLSDRNNITLFDYYYNKLVKLIDKSQISYYQRLEYNLILNDFFIHIDVNNKIDQSVAARNFERYNVMKVKHYYYEYSLLLAMLIVNDSENIISDVLNKISGLESHYANNKNVHESLELNFLFLMKDFVLDKSNSIKFHALKDSWSSTSNTLSLSHNTMFFKIWEEYIYCTSISEIEFYQALFSINAEKEKREMYLIANSINISVCMSVITVGYRLKEFAWTDCFFDKYRNHLKLQAKALGNVIGYLEAIKAFASGKFDHCLDILNTLSLLDVFPIEQARRLKLKTFYELEMFGLFEDYVNSSRKWYTQNSKQLPPYITEGGRAFFNNMNRIYKCRMANDIDGMQALAAEIEAQHFMKVFEQGYLLEKCNEVINPK